MIKRWKDNVWTQKAMEVVTPYALLSTLSPMQEAWAQEAAGAPPGGTAGFLISFVPFIFIFVLFYFLLILPQQKRAKKKREMVLALKKGDRIMLSSGIFGTVITLAQKTLVLQIAEGTRIKVDRDFIEKVVEETVDEEK